MSFVRAVVVGCRIVSNDVDLLDKGACHAFQVISNFFFVCLGQLCFGIVYLRFAVRDAVRLGVIPCFDWLLVHELM
jgi:hypothetical protein